MIAFAFNAISKIVWSLNSKHASLSSHQLVGQKVKKSEQSASQKCCQREASDVSVDISYQKYVLSSLKILSMQNVSKSQKFKKS